MIWLDPTIAMEALVVDLELLEGDANESARLCAAEARACLARFARFERFPGVAGEAGGAAGLPTTWFESALRWAEVGAQHAWGWERNRPEAWTRVTAEQPVPA